MSETKVNYQISANRDELGHFTSSSYGEKKLRSMKLTDYAWDKLEEIAREDGITRTDVIERFTRQKPSEKELFKSILSLLNEYVNSKKIMYKTTRYKSDFSTDTRKWSEFMEFYHFIENQLFKLKSK